MYLDLPLLNYSLRRRYWAMELVTDIPRSLTELHRVLKPGAKAAILDFHRPSNLQLRVSAMVSGYRSASCSTAGLTEEYACISPSLDRFPTGQSR